MSSTSTDDNSGFSGLLHKMYNNFRPIRDLSIFAVITGIWKENKILTFSGIFGLFGFYVDEASKNRHYRN